MKLVVVSYPENFKHEKEIVIKLFEEGLEYFHLRKHNFSQKQLEKYIEKIPKQYWNRIIIYDHFDLIDAYKLKGMHFNRKTRNKIGNYQYLQCHKSFSAHDLNEIKKLEHKFDYVFVSPVFDSISKNGYKQKISPAEINQFISSGESPYELVALGGITEHNVHELYDIGLGGIALLGNVWNAYFENKSIDLVISKFREVKRKVLSGRPNVLTIAGFDPSSGAGVTADIKTMERHEVYGLGVCSGITFQNDEEFENVDWLCAGKIKQQIDLLLKRHKIRFAKFGIIQSLNTLLEVVNHLKEKDNEIKIIWDPVLSSSSGFNIHENIDVDTLSSLLKEIYLITPNLNEAKRLFGTEEPKGIQEMFAFNKWCNVLLKGGHSNEDSVIDHLITNNNIFEVKGDKFEGETKHGTGCVLSSSIISNLAKGFDLETSCFKGKKYTEEFILSNNLKLGYHFNHEK